MIKQITIKGLSYLALLAGSWLCALVWWNLWMSHGMFGPIPFFHWFFTPDGESSYLFTEYEMLVQIMLLALTVVFSCKHLTSKGNSTRKSCAIALGIKWYRK